MKKAILLQPGKLGDLIISTPIAHYYYNLGYEIEWLIFDNFKSFFSSIPNIKIKTFNSLLNNNYYTNKRLNFTDASSNSASLCFFKEAYEYIKNNKEAKILDICWGFPGTSTSNNNLRFLFYKQKRNWIDMRYHLAEVPLKERWNFKWNRNLEKENKLLKFIKEFSKKKYGSEKFSIIHNYVDNPRSIQMKNPINLSYIKDYELYDWYLVLLEAEEIACVDSSLCNFVEVLPELKEKKKYYLGTEEPHYSEYMRNILLNNWYDSNNNLILSDYQGIL